MFLDIMSWFIPENPDTKRGNARGFYEYQPKTILMGSLLIAMPGTLPGRYQTQTKTYFWNAKLLNRVVRMRILATFPNELQLSTRHLALFFVISAISRPLALSLYTRATLPNISMQSPSELKVCYNFIYLQDRQNVHIERHEIMICNKRTIIQM